MVGMVLDETDMNTRRSFLKMFAAAGAAAVSGVGKLCRLEELVVAKPIPAAMTPTMAELTKITQQEFLPKLYVQMFKTTPAIKALLGATEKRV